ncbi:MAG: hypothetical protein JW829_15885 [Pirellulales bacterium]|nr:hypothetical protein [Pirellulales bacterium]
MRKLAFARIMDAIKGLLAAAILIVPLLGCGTEEPKKSPEELKKGQQEHAKRVQRELDGN